MGPLDRHGFGDPWLTSWFLSKAQGEGKAEPDFQTPSRRWAVCLLGSSGKMSSSAWKTLALASLRSFWGNDPWLPLEGLYRKGPSEVFSKSRHPALRFRVYRASNLGVWGGVLDFPRLFG